MAAPLARNGKGAQVWGRLAQVADPELDEPITDLGFVERVEIVGRDRVEVDFRLPTYWCSPNFAFLMADGIRREVAGLAWVDQVRVRLMDHMFADRVNLGVNDAREFSDVFAEYTDGGDLSEVRSKFDEKAFLRRQEGVLLALMEMGWSSEAIVAMTLADLGSLVLPAGQGATQLPRYRQALTATGRAVLPTDRAFTTWDGEPLTAEGFREHLADLRTVRINMEFNGALCRGLQETRYKEVDLSGREPELIDFLLNRVPPREQACAKTA